MADKNPNEGYASPQYVAFLLMKECQNEEYTQGKKLDRSSILDLYVECLRAVFGDRLLANRDNG